MPTISAIIITKNAARDLARCLDSLLWANEIIVLDAKSTDETQEICQNYPVKFFSADWPGFGPQKQRALLLATSDWVFSIDADERVDFNLQKEILAAIENNNDILAYKIPRLTFFYGKPVKHCFKPAKDAPIRLLKRGAGKFSDHLVHEIVLVDGKVGVLRSPLEHYSFRDLTDLINKINYYSTLSADQLFAKKKSTTPLKAFGHALWAFIKYYLIRRGFLDGWRGFLISYSYFEHSFYRYAKLLELNNYKADKLK